MPTPDSQSPPVGLIAGAGRLPVLTAEGIRAAGRRVACLGFRGHYDPDLPALCDQFGTVGVARLSSWIRKLRRFGAAEAVMVGRVSKQKMHAPLRIIRNLPDLRTLVIVYHVLRRDRRPAAMLTAVADALAREGIALIDSTRYIPDSLADPCVMTKRKPTPDQRGDIEFGWPLVTRLAELDIGQSIAVNDRDVIAVEAIEGTDAMIERAGRLCPRGGWTLIKASSPDQDMRLDVPTIGPTTIENLHRAGAACLVLEARRVILVDKQQTLDLADRHRIAVVGWPETPGQ